jgi:hypothetical protein
VGLPLGVELPGGGFISQEVRPEDKMAANSQNGDIITLLIERYRKMAYWEQNPSDGSSMVGTFQMRIDESLEVFCARMRNTLGGPFMDTFGEVSYKSFTSRNSASARLSLCK